MKKITFLFCFLIVGLAYGQTTVLEDFDSGTDPSWVGGNNPGAIEIIDSGDATYNKVGSMISSAAGESWQQADLLMQNNYIDVTTDKTVSVDINYTGVARTILCKLDGSSSGGGAVQITQDHDGNGWQTITFDFTSVGASGQYEKISFFWFFEGDGSGSSPVDANWNVPEDGITLLIDNITAVEGDAIVAEPGPTEGPTAPPARDAADVYSLYGGNENLYTDTTTPAIDFPTFGGSVFNGAVTLADGSGVLSWSNNAYTGIGNGAGGINVGSMEFLHLDFYTTSDLTGRPLKIKLESPGQNLELEVPGGGVLAADTWHSVDVDLAPYTNVDFTNLTYISIVTYSVPFSVDFWADNIYFYKEPSDDASNSKLADLTVDGVTIDGFSGNTTTYEYAVPSGTTDVPTIAATSEIAGANVFVTQATGIPGTGTITCVATNGTDSTEYTVTFVEQGPSEAAPTPPARDAGDVVAFYSDAYPDSIDTGYGQVDVFGFRAEENIGGDNYYNCGAGFQYNYYAGGGSVNLSGTTHLHFDYYVDSAPAGAVIGIQLIDDNNNNFYQVTDFAAGRAIGAWTSVDVPFGDFLNAGGGTDYSAVKLVQVNVINFSEATPAYIDNLYFYNDGSLSTENFETTEFTAFPNPTKNVWNIKGNNVLNSVSVYDVLGKNVINLEPNTNEVEIDATTFKTGLYFARIESVNGTKTIKLIKN